MKLTVNLWMRLCMICLFVVPLSANAAEYGCDVSSKRTFDRVYTTDELTKLKWSVKIVDNGDTAVLSRCSFSASANSVTCDDYPTDFVHQSSTGIKKYYYFRGHFDVQLFPDLSFIENNGRGSIAGGTCRLTRL